MPRMRHNLHADLNCLIRAVKDFGECKVQRAQSERVQVQRKGSVQLSFLEFVEQWSNLAFDGEIALL